MLSHMRSLVSLVLALATARRYGFVAGKYIPDLHATGRLLHLESVPRDIPCDQQAGDEFKFNSTPAAGKNYKGRISPHGALVSRSVVASCSFMGASFTGSASNNGQWRSAVQRPSISER